MVYQKKSPPHIRTFIVLTALALLTYHNVLTLPFYFDDLGIIPWMERQSLWEMWGTPGGMAYYRPLTFFLRKWIALTMGRYDPVVHHGINLATHVVSGCLVAWLVADLWPGRNRHARALAAGAIFILFPFSYQAVPWVTSLPHTLTAVLVLGAIAAYRRARWRLVIFLALLAPFSHETGLMLVPLLVAVELTRPGRPLLSHRLLRPLPLLLPALGYLIARALVPRNASSPSLPRLETLFQNGVYFLQGVAFPLEPLGGMWRRAGGGDVVAAGLVGVGALLLALIVQRARGGRASALPWLWIALALLPAWLMLPFDYVINGPRLLYLAAAGIAWLWADVILGLVAALQSPKLHAAGWALLLTAALLPGALFIHNRMELHRMGGEMLWQATEHALETAPPENHPALFVNLPSWLARREGAYALGHEGVQFLPGYVSMQETVYSNSQHWLAVEAVEFGNIVQEAPYWYGIYGPAQDWEGLAKHIWKSQAVFVATMGADRVDVRPVGGPSAGQPEATPLAFFAPHIYLESATARREGDHVRLELIWRYQGGAGDANVFVHGLAANGTLAAQADGPAVGRMLPFWLWRPGDRARDIRWLPKEVEQLRVGLYHSGGERLTAWDATNAQYPDNAVPIPVEGAD